MSARRYTRNTAPQDRLDYAEWAPINTDGLGEDLQRKVALLAEAIKRYIDGEPFNEELRTDGVYRETLMRAFNRCITLDTGGNPLGWRALCPGLHVKAYDRRAALIASGRSRRGGLAGAMKACLRQRPEIAASFDQYLMRSAKRAPNHEARLRTKSAHQRFLSLCEQAGVQEWEWPFSARGRARETVRRYVIEFLENHYDAIVGTQYGERAKARSRTGTGFESRLTASRPFDIVEIDEHRCQFIGATGVLTPDGMRWFAIEQINIIVVVDRCLNLVLGFKVVFRREANADDVLDALDSAVGNTAPRCHVEGIEVESRGGLPRDLGAPFDWCGFNQVLFDNALIHLAVEVAERARGLIGCDFNFGPVRHFERRPTIENVFGELERLGFRRIQSTVGTRPQDPMRQRPERVAEAACISVPHIVRLIESTILDRNGDTKKSNFGSTPLGALQTARDDIDGRGVILPVLPPLPIGVPGLDVSVVRLRVRGSKEDGRRPYFTFEGEGYTGKSMARDWSLLGATLLGHVKRRAIRQIRVFQRSGAFVDDAKVMGRWRRTEHSRDTRKHINGLIAEGKLRMGYTDCPVHRFLEAIASAAAKPTKGGRSPPQEDLAALAELQAFPVSPGHATGPVTSTEVTELEGPVLPDEPAHIASPDEVSDDDGLLDYEGLVAFDRSGE